MRGTGPGALPSPGSLGGSSEPVGSWGGASAKVSPPTGSFLNPHQPPDVRGRSRTNASCSAYWPSAPPTSVLSRQNRSSAFICPPGPVSPQRELLPHTVPPCLFSQPRSPLSPWLGAQLVLGTRGQAPGAYSRRFRISSLSTSCCHSPPLGIQPWEGRLPCSKPSC